MKIYKNPDGPDYDVLYPTLFFGAFGFITFFLMRTCISSDHFWMIGLFALLGSYLSYYAITKKRQIKRSKYANLFIASTATPLIIALILGINYFISFEDYTAKTLIDGHVFFDKSAMYVKPENSAQYCPRLFKLNTTKTILEYTYIETKINKGIFGYPVLKYHKFLKE